MERTFTLMLLGILSVTLCVAQVKSSYQYSTAMPYGTLDIRTKISSSNYYYLRENETFSFRESSPGVRTNTFLDMTSWDSSPYKQGNLRQKNGAADKFIMNYRLLMPKGYNSAYAEGYPMIVIMHGAIERANCYYNNCYHGTPAYTVDANSPPAPKTVTSKLLNNDHHLSVGGSQHLAAVNLAGTRLPNDPGMPSKAFPGFILMPQMFDIWDSLQVQDMVRIVRLLTAQYKIDQNRIYITGLSIGGYAVYEAMKRASWLFAAALPMSAVWDANIFKQNQQARVAHIPLWTFQGGKDPRPSPAFTENIINNFRKAGAVVRYSLYADLGHNVWNRAWAQSDYFSWMLSKNKANLHPYAGNTVIDKSRGIKVKLMLPEGFLAYQWEKDGVKLSITTPTYTVAGPGVYRARFSRLSTAPTEAQWNRWSAALKVTQTTTATTVAARSTESSNLEMEPEADSLQEVFSFSVYPNPATPGNVNLHLQGNAGEGPVHIRMADPMGKEVLAFTVEGDALSEDQRLVLPPSVQGGVYVLLIQQGSRQIRTKLVLQN